MTQEEKQLLLADLCVRLPYGVRVKLNGRRETSNKLTIDWLYTYSRHIEDIKPYLRQMSSMTDEERKEFIYYASYEIEESVNGRHYEYYLKDGVGTPEEPTCNYDAIDWLNAHYFDYRGLIEKGLALEAPEGMYNAKTE